MSKKPLFTLFFTVFIDLVGFGILLPLTPFYARELGASETQVGMLQSTYSLMQFFFAPVWGRLSDRVGRRPIMLMSILGASISFMFFGLAGSLWVLFVCRIFQGACGANFSVAFAYVADITTPENRAKGMGLMGAAFGLGFVVGPALGALLYQIGPSIGNFLHFSNRNAFGLGFPAIFASLLCILNFLMSYKFLPESLKAELRKKNVKHPSRYKTFLKALASPKLSWLVILIFVASFSMANMEGTFALFGHARLGYGVKETGKLFAAIGLMMVFTQGYLIRKLLPKLGERKMIIVGTLFTTLGMGLMVKAFSVEAVLLSMAFLAVGSGMTNPMLTSGVSMLTDAADQGAMLGLTQSLGSLARATGPTFGCYLLEKFGAGAPYIAASSIMAVAFLIILSRVHFLPQTFGKSGIQHGH